MGPDSEPEEERRGRMMKTYLREVLGSNLNACAHAYPLKSKGPAFRSRATAEREGTSSRACFLCFRLNVRVTAGETRRQQPRGNETRNLKHARLFVNSRGENFLEGSSPLQMG